MLGWSLEAALSFSAERERERERDGFTALELTHLLVAREVSWSLDCEDWDVNPNQGARAILHKVPSRAPKPHNLPRYLPYRPLPISHDVRIILALPVSSVPCQQPK